MFSGLSEAINEELERLAEMYGQPLVRVIELGHHRLFDPISKKDDRFGEVCMVVRRPNGRLLTMTKEFYPRGVSRLPTGGMHPGEDIYAALLRETSEETGLDVEVRRFLAAVAYQLEDAKAPPVFYTFAFLLDEVGGTLETLDESERVEAFFEVEPEALPAVAQGLEQVETTYSSEIEGNWGDWGRFRAAIHRVVWEALGNGKR